MTTTEMPSPVKLSREIDRLTELQLAALKQSVFGGMTPAEALAYAARRVRIMQLSSELASRQFSSDR